MHSIININVSLTLKLLNVNDVKRHLPELLTAMKEWYRTCKIPDGNPENQFAFSREQKHVTVIQTVQLASHLVLCWCLISTYSTDIIRGTAETWEKLIAGKATLEEHYSPWTARRLNNSNSILSAAIGPPSISLTISEPGGKSCSKAGTPAPLILAKTACLKCQRRSWSTGRSGSLRNFWSSCLPAILFPSLLKNTTL